VAGNTLLKFFFGEMLDQLREDGASRVHQSLFHPIDRRKEVNPAPFQFKSFLLRPCVIGLIFNELGQLPDNLAGQQCLVLIRRQPEPSPIMSAWVILIPYVSARRGYVRYGCGGNNYCDSGDCLARASRVKRVSKQ
jgi:hypothetical protein